MKKKVFFKILIIFVIFIIVLTTQVMATAKYTSEDLVDPTQFDPYKSNSTSKIDKVINNGLGIALSLIRNAALGWAIIMLTYIAIKYMISTPEIKGQLKKDVPTYVFGAILLFGSAGIMQLITYFVGDTVGL